MIIIAGHATRTNGYIHEFPNVLLIEVLNQQKESFYYIRHSIDGKAKSQLLKYSRGELKLTKVLPTISHPSVLRYICETVLNLVLVCQLSHLKHHVTFIGIDPLNAISGIILHRFKIVTNTVFYAADYSSSRFTQVILNKIYLWCDCFAVRYSTQTWNVSSRIQNLHSKLVKQDQLAQNIFVPNVPIVLPAKTKIHHNRLKLITSGILDKNLDFFGLFQAVGILKENYQKIELVVVGDGPMKFELEKIIVQMNLSQNIRLLGYMPHDQLLEILTSCGIGIALYNGKWSFNYYGDSMKCREFMAFGLPVITTNTHSTADEIIRYKTGLVCKQSPHAYANAIEKVINDYKYYSENAWNFARKYDHKHLNMLRSVDPGLN